MDTIKDPHSELKSQLLREILKSSGQAKLPVTGTSMLSSIWPGDVLEVSRQNATDICPGEVVLFERDGRLLAHRVVEKVGGPERSFLITQGDRQREPELPVSPEELLGRVTAIVRGGRRIEPRLTRWGRVASWVLSRSDLCTRLALRLRKRT
jgi:phage repressor protein C with HTH and peptisase S24 domain